MPRTVSVGLQGIEKLIDVYRQEKTAVQKLKQKVVWKRESRES